MTAERAGNVLSIEPARRGLHGHVRVPGDKSISHRALLLAGIAEGRSRLRGLSDGVDVQRTRDAVVATGAAVTSDPAELSIDGGRGRLREPAGVIDVGNSGTTMRLMSGWCAAFPWLTVIDGDDSIARRPMGRVVEPLRTMGASIDGRQDGRLAPLVIRGGHLHGIDYLIPVPSAQVKSAVLLAGLAASGETTVRETVPTRAHTEELLAACGADIVLEPDAITVRPSVLHPLDIDIPGDPSQAAFWIVAACLIPGSELTVGPVYVGPARTGFLEVLARMGADVTVEPEHARAAAATPAQAATIRARSGPLKATTVEGDEVAGLIDEIPILAVAAAFADGTTTFRDAGELRVKESDRIATMVAGLRALGARVEGLDDGLVVDGTGGAPLGPPPKGAAVDAHGDHRVAMALAIAALAGAGATSTGAATHAGAGDTAPVAIAGWNAVATSYPGFLEDLRRCQS